MEYSSFGSITPRAKTICGREQIVVSKPDRDLESGWSKCLHKPVASLLLKQRVFIHRILSSRIYNNNNNMSVKCQDEARPVGLPSIHKKTSAEPVILRFSQ